MSMLHTDAVDRVLSLCALEVDFVLEEMETQAEQENFPTIGREVGAFLRLCARLTDAKSVFEFGSGFGYSAYWVAPVVGPEGRIVLTEVDADELEQARTYFERGGYADRAVFEQGDALESVDRHEGPFDLVLVDHQNHRYVEAFEAVREKVAPGGIVVADNVLNSGPVMSPEDVEAALLGETSPSADSTLEGMTEYYRHVRDDPEFETTLIPVGEGLFASIRV